MGSGDSGKVPTLTNNRPAPLLGSFCLTVPGLHPTALLLLLLPPLEARPCGGETCLGIKKKMVKLHFCPRANEASADLWRRGV